MFTGLVPWQPISLGADFRLRAVASLDDVERVAAFNAQMFFPDPRMDQFVRALIVDHPAVHSEHWLLVEEETSNRIVASLGLVPWEWDFEGVRLRCAEMACVATHPDFRRRGLIRQLAARFARTIGEDGYELSGIEGIPYFYRQFGYSYALPLEIDWRIDPYMIPTEPACAPLRRAGPDDLPVLQSLYERTVAQLDLRTVRDAACWRYQLGPAVDTATGSEFWLLPDGYVRVSYYGFGAGLIVSEASDLSAPSALCALQHLKSLALERGNPYIRLNLSESSSLVQVSRSLGAHFIGRYAWQMRIPSIPALLRRLAPLLERRLAHSLLAGLTKDLHLCLYREAYTLHFAGGRLIEVSESGLDQPGELHLPPFAAPALLLGDRSLDELRAIYPDVMAEPATRPLIDTLFPKRTAFLYAIY